VVLIAVGIGIGVATAGGNQTHRTMIVVAHQDDNLLFMLPDEFQDFSPGSAVETVYLTAGDAGRGSAFWHMRERAALAATAALAHAKDSWVQSRLPIDGHQITMDTLVGDRRVVSIFFRLPDGNENGLGWPTDANQSLEKLWKGQIPTIRSVDGTEDYSRSGLVSALLALMNRFQPKVIRTQDYDGYYGDSDHSDHITTAFLTRAAADRYRAPHTLLAYQGYPDERLPPNVSNGNLTRKFHVFVSYASKMGGTVCNSFRQCEASPLWRKLLRRQYLVASETS
jgi:LmbE family N-acetylglucosaminyl deacetylase